MGKQRDLGKKKKTASEKLNGMFYEWHEVTIIQSVFNKILPGYLLSAVLGGSGCNDFRPFVFVLLNVDECPAFRLHKHHYALSVLYVQRPEDLTSSHTRPEVC